jgi:hypothetical protein
MNPYFHFLFTKSIELLLKIPNLRRRKIDLVLVQYFALKILTFYNIMLKLLITTFLT